MEKNNNKWLRLIGETAADCQDRDKKLVLSSYLKQSKNRQNIWNNSLQNTVYQVIKGQWSLKDEGNPTISRVYCPEGVSRSQQGERGNLWRAWWIPCVEETGMRVQRDQGNRESQDREPERRALDRKRTQTSRRPPFSRMSLRRDGEPKQARQLPKARERGICQG